MMNLKPNSRLYDFVQLMYFIRHGKKMLPAEHHHTICNALTRVIKGEINRLIISISPRSGKTLLVSQMLPSFWMGLNPASNFILTSYSKTLAASNTYAIREIMRHELYQSIFRDTAPRIRDDSQARHEFMTEAGGVVYGVGSGGTITGKGAGGMGPLPSGAILIDDIAKPDEALSERMRESTIEWFRGTLESRKNSPKTPIIVVGQRLHEMDLSGWLLSGGNGEEWTEIKIPAKRDDGTSFWEKQFPIEMLDRLEKASPYTFASQYQQEPSPRGGGFFKPGNIDVVDAVPAQGRTVRGWDLAASDGTGDWTVGIKLRESDGVIYIMDCARIQGSPDEVERLLINTAKVDGDLQSIPQDPGQAGKAQVAYLSKKLRGTKFSFTTETGPKITRAESIASQVNVGNVKMIRAPWNEQILHELAAFPKGANDDIVDALSRAYNYLVSGSNYSLRNL